MAEEVSFLSTLSMSRGPEKTEPKVVAREPDWNLIIALNALSLAIDATTDDATHAHLCELFQLLFKQAQMHWDGDLRDVVRCPELL